MADEKDGTPAEQGEAQSEALGLLKKLRELLGIAPDTNDLDTLEAAVAKLDALLGDKEVASSVRELLSLPADAGKAAVVLAMRTRDASGASAELVEMRAAEADRVAQEHVDRHVKALKINANDVATMAAALELAKAQPELLDRIMANAASVMPEQGKTTAPDHTEVSRTRTILSAARTYRDDAGLRKTTSAVAFINLELREHEMAALGESEIREFAVV